MDFDPPVSSTTLDQWNQRYSRLESVYRLTRRMVSALSEEEICSIAIEALLEVTPTHRTSLLLFDQNSVMRFRAWHGLSERYRTAVEGHSPWRPLDVTAKAYVVQDVTLDSTLDAFSGTFASEKIRSLAFVPLLGRSSVLGKFMIYGEFPGDPLAGDLALVENIADHVAIVVERVRSKQELLRDQAMFAAGPAIVFRWRREPGWPVEYVSPNVSQLGYSADDFLKRGLGYFELVHPDDVTRIQSEGAGFIESGAGGYEQRYRLRDAAGGWRWLYDHTTVGRDSEGRPCSFTGYVLDITGQRKLEQELLQAQKMESVGRLAGGVAHDFNNLLTVILGAAEHASAQAPPGTDLARAVNSISIAAGRAASLTAQLLAFARQQVIAPSVINLNQLLGSVSDLLHRTLGENLELVIEPSDASPWVRMDPGQAQQILMNLALNARDAMPNGGRLTLSTSGEATGSPAPVHDMVELSAHDTGVGMSAETLEHIFEPFFTTKDIGKGTGLGLATCYGIVKQNGGRIRVESRLGEGSCFRISLPRVQAADAQQLRVPEPNPGAHPGSGATVLLAEDDELVREFTLLTLRRGGFEVIEAANGVEALARASAHPGVIDLLITDLMMPLMGGHELAQQVRRTRPALRVLYCTGYDPENIPETAGGGPQAPVITKPFTAAQLITKARHMLAETSAAATGQVSAPD